MRALIKFAILIVTGLFAIGGNPETARADDAANIKLVQAAYEAFGKGDIPAILAMVTDDVTWQTTGPMAACPCFGPRKGKPAVGEFFKIVNETWEFTEFKPMTFSPSGDKVFVLGHYAMKVKKNAKPVASDWIHIFTIKDGKVTDFKEFMDSAALAEGAKG